MIDIRHGDCLDLLRQMDDNSVDSIVTDPPYGLNFMNKHWDYQLPDVAIWTECLRVLKPGGHMACFGGSRTHHRIWCDVENAGFEIRDTLMWITAQGFPKSLDVSKSIDKLLGCEREIQGLSINDRTRSDDAIGWDQGKPIVLSSPSSPEAKLWDGWGTALKPAHEPILLARKPLSEKSVAKNVLRWGTGAINVDASRVETNGEQIPFFETDGRQKFVQRGEQQVRQAGTSDKGRYPANIILEDCDEVRLAFPEGKDRYFARFPSRSIMTGQLPSDTISQWEQENIHCNSLASHVESKPKHPAQATKVCSAIENAEQKVCERDEIILPDTSKTDIGCSDGISVTENTITNLSIAESGKMPMEEKSLRDTSFIIGMKSKLTTASTTSNLCDAEITDDSTISCISPNPRSLPHEQMPRENIAPESDSIPHGSKKNDLDHSREIGLDAHRVFYCAKASKADRCESRHPTIKPIKLLTWLVSLVTPPGGIVLDPFAGSGTTGQAAFDGGFDAILMEREAEYVADIRRRFELPVWG